jgi:hypothetical protein
MKNIMNELKLEVFGKIKELKNEMNEFKQSE